MVTAASVQDRDGANSLLAICRHQCSRSRYIWADGAYADPLVDWVRVLRPRRLSRLEMTKRFDAAKALEVIPKRWMVESSHSSYPSPDTCL